MVREGRPTLIPEVVHYEVKGDGYAVSCLTCQNIAFEMTLHEQYTSLAVVGLFERL